MLACGVRSEWEAYVECDQKRKRDTTDTRLVRIQKIKEGTTPLREQLYKSDFSWVRQISLWQFRGSDSKTEPRCCSVSESVMKVISNLLRSSFIYHCTCTCEYITMNAFIYSLSHEREETSEWIKKKKKKTWVARHPFSCDSIFTIQEMWETKTGWTSATKTSLFSLGRTAILDGHNSNIKGLTAVRTTSEVSGITRMGAVLPD